MSRRKQKNDDNLVIESKSFDSVTDGSDSLVIEHLLKGGLDECDIQGIRGWVMDENAPDTVLEVAVFIDDLLISHTTANIFRQDLLDAHIGNGQYAFNIAIPDTFFDNKQHKVEITETEKGLLLKGCPKFFTLTADDRVTKNLLLIEASAQQQHKTNDEVNFIDSSNNPQTPVPAITLKGHLESCDGQGIQGWVIDKNSANNPVKVDILIDGNLLTQTTANCFRQDLLIAGIDEGRCGFKAIIPAVFFDSVKHQVEVREAISQSLIGNQSFVLPDPQKVHVSATSEITGKQVKQAFASLGTKRIEFDEDSVKLIAYYLPQFHPILENDEWWGAGFTEWTNVTQAVPYFKNHYQPKLPGEFGYYDLRLPEVREAQAKLAQEYGIYGFCYYYYWFAGRRILERPLQEMFESGKPDFPFCICWANENWSRRWDGSEQDILIQQVHNEQTDEDFIYDVIPLFKDPRYIKVNGAPLLILYRVSLLPNPEKTTQKWRDICADNGIPEIHLCMAETFAETEPRPYGFDCSVQFPPHNVSAGMENANIPDLDEEFTGKIFDFEVVVQDQLSREQPVYKQFPGVMTAWDNTSRKKKAGNIFMNSTPKMYEVWLRGAIDRAQHYLPKGEKLVFINAWNEWAEGTFLEPDKKNGRAYLEATRRAITGQSDWKLALDYAEKIPELSGAAKENFIADMRFSLERLSKVNQNLMSIMGLNGLPKQFSTMKPGLPFGWKELRWSDAGAANIDRINHCGNPNTCIAVDSSQKLWLEGWAYHDAEHELKENSISYLLLEDVNSIDTYCALILRRSPRSDVMEYLHNANVLFSGIKSLIDITLVPRGNYRVGVAMRSDKRVIFTAFKAEIEVV